MGGAAITYIEKTDSTMLEARRRAAGGAASGEVVWAGEQTAGRGRTAGRRWEAGPGDGLLFTIIYRRADLSSVMAGRPLTVLPLLCGLAVLEAVSELLGACGPDAELRIKWPNDVLAGGRKISGILCESSGDFVYAGIGINLNQTGFPPGLRRPAVSLRQLLNRDSRISLEEGRKIIETVRTRIDACLTDPAWRERLSPRLFRFGEEVVMRSGLPEELAAEREGGAEDLTGVIRGVGRSGALVLDTADGLMEIVSGELVV